MKIRQGFVSNSSSSSFIVFKNKISANQLYAIQNHIEVAQKYFKEILYAEKSESWNIEEKFNTLRVSTLMDNFDMEAFFNQIGLSTDSYKYLDYYSSWNDEDSEKSKTEFNPFEV